MNLMGFKKVDKIPPARHGRGGRAGMYDDLLKTVGSKNGIYHLDTKDIKRVKYLANTLRNRSESLGLSIRVAVRGSSVYLEHDEQG